MNKIIPTNERLFMRVCGASGSRKMRLIYSMLTQPVDPKFQPAFKHVVCLSFLAKQFITTLSKTLTSPLLFSVSNQEIV